jgi:hypothetical protein
MIEQIAEFRYKNLYLYLYLKISILNINNIFAFCGVRTHASFMISGLKSDALDHSAKNALIFVFYLFLFFMFMFMFF